MKAHIDTVQYRLCYRELVSHCESSFDAVVRGGQVDLSPGAGFNMKCKKTAV